MCLSLLSFSLRWRETDWSCCISPSQQPPPPAAASTWSCRSCKWLQMVTSQPQEPTLPQVLVLGWVSVCAPRSSLLRGEGAVAAPRPFALSYSMISSWHNSSATLSASLAHHPDGRTTAFPCPVPPSQAGGAPGSRGGSPQPQPATLWDGISRIKKNHLGFLSVLEV